MVHIAEPQRRRRRYSSRLRKEQAEQTRERILEAVIRTMARGVAELSIPAVAREAGVSVPTVYRHFATKRDLIAALGPYAAAKAQLMPDAPLETLDQLDAFVRLVFERHDHLDPVLRAAMTSELGNEVRRAGMPDRRGATRRFVERAVPELSGDDTERMTDTLVILLSSATSRAFRDYLGFDAAQAADHVNATVHWMIEGARATKGS